MRNYTAAVPSFQLPSAGELILGGEQGLLCLQHRKQVGRPLPVLQLGYLERLLRCHDQPAQVIFHPAGIGDLGQGELHIGVGVERGALIGGDKFPLDIFGQIFLPFESDVELLDQALINLMRNAIEALRDEPRGRITLSALNEPSGRAVISVTDNGPGIASDQREKVFVPFSTTKRQGSGVGLTLVRQIATVHGGAVSIADAPGGGAVISLRF